LGRAYKSAYLNGQVGQFQTLATILVEPKTIGSVMYGAYNTYQLMSVQRSFDLGVTWERVGHGISYPSYAGQMYFCGNDSIVFCHINGDIYASKNKGYSWFAINDNILNKKVSSIFLSNDTLYAATVRDSLYFIKVSNVSPRIVTGKVYFDNNNNTTYDETIDNPIPNVHIYSVSTGSLAVTDSLGNYELELSHATSNDTVRALNPFLYTHVTPSQYVVNQSDTLKNFSFFRIQSKNDLRVDITSTDIPRPGFLYHLHITCKNEGTTTLDGNLILNHNPFFQYMLSTLAPAQINQSSISWNFPNFEPLQSYSFVVKFRVDSTATIIGLPVQMSASIFPIISDETPENNTDSISDIVVGSYDPNDKQVNRPTYLSPMQVFNKTEMVYTVRFQNTGTWYAENVSILDTLHRNLDLSTFRVISASHDYNFDFSGNGIVRFNFPNINLPDSNMNEAASHGFIKYAIRLNNNIPLNDSITNTAHIYFDFNEAIVTNTALNIVKIDAAINETNQDFNLNVYPNPAKTLLNIRFEKFSSYNLTLFSIDGRIVMNEKSNSEHHVLNIASLDKGIYLLKVSDNNRSKIVKVVIQ
ncbi:MAG: T9SS type A sorting domain-containing protein, partial [Bacteroidales bacterium]|nr:T9SS type A sorting domain-containing protein [Bacteroidales bacterium]